MGTLPEVNTPSAMVEWLLLIGSLFMANQILWGAARRLLTTSFSSFSDAIRAGVGMPPAPPSMIGQRIGQIATGAVMGAVSGGQIGAVMGGLSGLIGGPMMVNNNTGNRTGSETNGIGGGKEEQPQRGNVFIQNGATALPQNPAMAPALSATMQTPLNVIQPIAAQPRSNPYQPALNGVPIQSISAIPTPAMPIVEPVLIGSVPRPVVEPQKQNAGMPKINRAPNPAKPAVPTPAQTQTTRAVAASKALSPDEK